MSKNQRKTQQRTLLKGIIEQASGPMTVNEIWQKASDNQDNLGMATVYRTISLLIESHQIEKVVLSDGQARYEMVHPKSHHHHFLCRECDRSYCFEVCPIDKAEVKKIPSNFIVESHEITFFGVCSNCQ